MKTGARIKQMREAAGMTQQELAEKIGAKGAGAISHYESGRRQISADRLPAFAAALGCRAAQLVEDEADEMPKAE